MNIDLRIHKYDSGAYGLVFFDEMNGTAVKIFSTSHDRTQAENVFNSECRAYEKAMCCPNIQNLVPTFFGKRSVNQIIDKNGQDITHLYYSDLVYEMSFEYGSFCKLQTISKDEISRITNLFKSAGINYVTDSSVILDNNLQVRKIIDFAEQEFEVWR